MVKFALVSCVGNSGNMKGKFTIVNFSFNTILKPGFINGLSKLCVLWCQVVMYFEKFQTHEQPDADFRMCWSSHSALFGPEIKRETLCRLRTILPYLYCIKWVN